MDRTASWMCALALVACSAMPVFGQDMERMILDAMSTTPLGQAKVGMCVIDGDSGRTLFALNARDQFIPASNMKLLTSGAALHVLGTDFMFRTRFLLAGDELVIRGAGDPALADPELLADMMPSMSCTQFIDRLAEVITDNGLSTIQGIVVDDRIFEASAAHPTWPDDQLNESYCAEISGLNFHANVLNVFARPNGNGVRVETDPEYPDIVLQPSVELMPTTVRGRAESIWMTRQPMTNTIKVSGRISKPMHSPVSVTVHDPGMQFGMSLAVALARRGVEIGGTKGVTFAHEFVRRAEQNDKIDPALDVAREIVVVRTPMQVVLERCNTNSENMYAESLLKRMGHDVTLEPGSWENGTATLRMVVGDLLDARSVGMLRAVDGSGMSRENRVTPELLANWTRAVANDPVIGDTWVESLAEPGNGTLRERFRESNTLENILHAKTGYLTGVRSISGVIEHRTSGKKVYFSLIMNDESSVDANARKFQEKFVMALDEWLNANSYALGG
ncbi:MAG: D-alanyl-D-alanine carboxypeptidase/D-alanyl-D-alanine-endopeptidase [Phycisphaeraceae bacterium]|nr:D-alanyl-D-alanine carboxypeptidase/D-alanyl-D-alanine-endopeptidase [Phycisphaerales bacterium]MCB9860838.1 D-alanyl-D-alanine carboxypeptidase/D-alanyl-D-alanine-endopeptidase [Phycisphaeraceae bacterium]